MRIRKDRERIYKQKQIWETQYSIIIIGSYVDPDSKKQEEKIRRQLEIWSLADHIKKSLLIFLL